VIRISLQLEPSDFGARVRQPGQQFLKTNPNPTNKDFRNKCYWTRCLGQLRSAYNCICAYSACWIPTQGSVDHFWPKSLRPDLAYEWSNFRLASEKLNNYKQESTSVVDPMTVQAGWFAIDFHSFYIVPGAGLSNRLKHLIRTTINTLRLNSDDSFVNLRFEITKDFAKGDVSFEYLKRRYPFIAAELERQSLSDAIKTTFR